MRIEIAYFRECKRRVLSEELNGNKRTRFCVSTRIVIEEIGWDQGPFVAAFASSNLGDVSPNTRGPKCEFSGNNCSKQYTCPGRKEMCFASGPGRNMFESTSIIANKMFKESWVSQVSLIFLLSLTLCKFPFVRVFVCSTLDFFFYYNKVWIILCRYFIVFVFFFMYRNKLINQSMISSY